MWLPELFPLHFILQKPLHPSSSRTNQLNGSYSLHCSSNYGRRMTKLPPKSLLNCSSPFPYLSGVYFLVCWSWCQMIVMSIWKRATNIDIDIWMWTHTSQRVQLPSRTLYVMGRHQSRNCRQLELIMAIKQWSGLIRSSVWLWYTWTDPLHNSLANIIHHTFGGGAFSIFCDFRRNAYWKAVSFRISNLPDLAVWPHSMSHLNSTRLLLVLYSRSFATKT